MKVFESSCTFDYSWTNVSIANWRKYCAWNTQSEHVVAVDTLSRSIDPDTGVVCFPNVRSRFFYRMLTALTSYARSASLPANKTPRDGSSSSSGPKSTTSAKSPKSTSPTKPSSSAPATSRVTTSSQSRKPSSTRHIQTIRSPRRCSRRMRKSPHTARSRDYARQSRIGPWRGSGRMPTVAD